MQPDNLPKPVQRTGRWAVVALGSALFAVILVLSPRWATSGIDASGSDQLFAASRASQEMLATASAWEPAPLPAPEPAPVPVAPSTDLGSDGYLPVGGTLVPGTDVEAPDSPDPDAIDPDAVTEDEDPARIEVDPSATDKEGAAGLNGGDDDEDGWEPHDGDGSLSLWISAPTSDGSDELRDEDWVTWTLYAENTGDEYLWGVYVFLEGHGRLTCDDRQLDVGETTECWGEAEVWEGSHTAHAWVTAWTTEWMVDDWASREYSVGAW